MPPSSHPFTERLVGAIRREYLDQVLFGNRRDLEKKLEKFKAYYNAHRVHQALNLHTPEKSAGNEPPSAVDAGDFTWLSHRRGMFQTALAA